MWQKAKHVDINHLPVPERNSVTINGTEISYREFGSGTLLFCMPPWPSSSLVFAPIMQALGDHVKFIAPDLPGWGGYSGKMTSKPNVTNYAALMNQFVESFNPEEYNLLGYSFGGALAQFMVRTARHLPKKLVFVSTIHSGDDLMYTNSLAISLARFALKLKIPLSLLKPIAKQFVLRERGATKEKFYSAYHDTQFYKQIVLEDMRSDLRTILSSILSLQDYELLNRQELQPESLVVYADSDPGFVKRESNEMAKFLEVQPVYLENTDHDHFAFDVNKSADIILNFLLA